MTNNETQCERVAKLKSLFDKWLVGTCDDAETAQEAVMEMVPDILAALATQPQAEADKCGFCDGSGEAAGLGGTEPCHKCQAEAQPGVAELVEAVEAAKMAKTRLERRADRCHNGMEDNTARDWGRAIWASFSDFDTALANLTPAQPAGDVRESDKVEYLIWSGEHNAYWCPDAAGYSTRIRDAGRYSLEDAKKRTAHCGPEKRIEIEPIAAISATPEVSDG